MEFWKKIALQQKIGQLIYIGINCACMWVSELCVCGWFVCVPGRCPCVHQFVYAKICLVRVRKTERQKERVRDEVLATETNSAVVFDHMIPYICCSVGSWTVSTAHNDNMFHMNPTPHCCQRLATKANPAAHICNILPLVRGWSQ